MVCHVRRTRERTLLSWAEYVGATSGAVPVNLEASPIRVDVSLDRTALPFGGSIDHESDSRTNLFLVAVGRARYRLLVRDQIGRAVPSARVRLLGRTAVRTNDAGVATLDSVAGGTQTIGIVAIGYQPKRRTIDVIPGTAIHTSKSRRSASGASHLCSSTIRVSRSIAKGISATGEPTSVHPQKARRNPAPRRNE